MSGATRGRIQVAAVLGGGVVVHLMGVIIALIFEKKVRLLRTYYNQGYH